MDHFEHLTERMAELEAKVEALQDEVTRLKGWVPVSKPKTKVLARKKEDKGPAPSKPDLRKAMAWKSEDWLNKIGIGLVLFGVAFLFRYAIDKEWITPMVRVGFGFAIGVTMLFLGLRIRSKRLPLSRVLLGGSIAVFYAVGFSAYQLYALVPYTVAFVFMIGVTVFAFILAIREDDALFSVVGTLGGLGTPFILYHEPGNMVGLMVYTCLVLAGTMAVYWKKAWHSLLIAMVLGGWAVFFTGLANLPHEASFQDRMALQLGVMFGGLVFWAIPLLRAVLHERNPIQWPAPVALLKRFEHLFNEPLRVYSLTTPLLMLGLSTQIWHIEGTFWGWVALVGVVIWAGTAYFLPASLEKLVKIHRFAAALLLLYATGQLLDDYKFGMQATFAVEAVLLYWAGTRLRDNGLRGGGHVLMAILALVILVRLMEGKVHSPAVFNVRALANLTVIGAGVGVSFLMKGGRGRQFYRLMAHLFFLGWMYQELVQLPSGEAFVSVAWGVYAIVLLLLALRFSIDTMRMVALGTILLIVGKLFLIDLANLEPIWRILLFLGLGAVFLGLSYAIPGLWQGDSEA